MLYADQQAIVDLYGEDLLLIVSDHDGDGNPDEQVVHSGLTSAHQLVDAYLSAQYTVPLTNTPGIVKKCTIDIAVYNMALDQARRTTEMRVRYEDALKHLELIAKGTIGLGLPPEDTDDDGVLDSDPNAKRKGGMFDWGRA